MLDPSPGQFFNHFPYYLLDFHQAQQSRDQPGGHNRCHPQLVGAQEQTLQKRIYPDSL